MQDAPIDASTGASPPAEMAMALSEMLRIQYCVHRIAASRAGLAGAGAVPEARKWDELTLKGNHSARRSLALTDSPPSRVNRRPRKLILGGSAGRNAQYRNPLERKERTCGEAWSVGS
jgi:hypothetical protein